MTWWQFLLGWTGLSFLATPLIGRFFFAVNDENRPRPSEEN